MTPYFSTRPVMMEEGAAAAVEDEKGKDRDEVDDEEVAAQEVQGHDEVHAASEASRDIVEGSWQAYARGKKKEEDELKERPPWQKDEEASACKSCSIKFSFARRRHHCRGCGFIFCHPCSDHWLMPPSVLAYDEPQRFCEECFRRVSPIDYSTHFDEYGDPSNPAVVLVHGASGTRMNFVPQLPALVDKYYVLIPDMPGHASRIGEELTMASATRVIAELIRQQVPQQKAVVLGCSMGGFIAMAFGGTYPELCSGLVVACSGTDAEGAKNGLRMMGYYYAMLSNKTKASLVRKWAGSYPLNAEVERELLDAAIASTGGFYDCWQEIAALMSGESYATHLSNFPGPVLFINGAKDFRGAVCVVGEAKKLTKVQEEKYLKAARNGRKYVVDGAGHLVLLDRRYRDKCNEVIVEFLQQVNAAEEAQCTDVNT